MMLPEYVSVPRRAYPRVPVQAFCSEVCGDSLRHALVVDLSARGLRLQRPLGGPRTRSLQLEIEVPGVDEVIWANGEICFDAVWKVPSPGSAGLSGVLRTSGVRVVAAATRHLRILREYAVESWRSAERAAEEASEPLGMASCYRCG